MKRRSSKAGSRVASGEVCGGGHDAGEAGGVGVAAVLHALEVVAAGGIGEGEQGSALVPGVAGGTQADVHGDAALPVAVGQGNGLEPDAAGVKAVVAQRRGYRVWRAARDKVHGIGIPQDHRVVAQCGNFSRHGATGVQSCRQKRCCNARKENGSQPLHAAQDMSLPQHWGDLILPSQLGHLDT